jgi:hypothetical protein
VIAVGTDSHQRRRGPALASHLRPGGRGDVELEQHKLPLHALRRGQVIHLQADEDTTDQPRAAHRAPTNRPPRRMHTLVSAR